LRTILVVLLAIFFCLPVNADSEQAIHYSNRTGGCALIIWQNGRTLVETYQNGGAPERRENLYSITKSLGAIGVFSAVGRSWLQLDQPASSILMEWKSHSDKRTITIRQLLNQTSGLSPGFGTLYAKNLQNKEKRVLESPVNATAGKGFSYGPSHYEALEAVLARKLDRNPIAWINQSVLGRGENSDLLWRSDAQGRPFFSAGLKLTARDLLAVGHLVRRRGWRGISSVFPASLVKQVEAGSSANAMYGMGFWLNRHAAKKEALERDIEQALSLSLSSREWAASCLSRSAPSDLIVMAGSHGQRVYTSRSRNLVIVRLGRGGGFRDPDFLHAFFGNR